MDERINDKITEIEKYLEELESILPGSFEEYSFDWKIRDICERRFEKIIEAVIDLGFLIIKGERLEMPKDDENVFCILRDNKLISAQLYEKLKQAKGMRNIITHQYGKIDDELVFEAVSEQLVKDVSEFLKCVKEGLR
jgi:uncharacterized protein YutE (UPF0331/DUF86 family)